MTSTTENPGTRATASVRSARPEEFEEIGELTVAGFSVGPYPPDAERRAQLADAAGRAASAGGTEHSRFAEPHELEFRLLAVSPDARRRGIGALLLEDAVDRARERGFVRLVLDTGARNEAAQRRYHRASFSRLPERENRLGRGGLRLAVFGRDASPVAEAELWVAADTLSGEPLGTMTLPRPGHPTSSTGPEGELDLGRSRSGAPAARARRRAVAGPAPGRPALPPAGRDHPLSLHHSRVRPATRAGHPRRRGRDPARPRARRVRTRAPGARTAVWLVCLGRVSSPSSTGAWSASWSGDGSCTWPSTRSCSPG